MQAEKAIQELIQCQGRIQQNPTNMNLIQKEIQQAKHCIKLKQAREEFPRQ